MSLENLPAFPCETDGNANGFQSGAMLWTYPGMTLRDWFAGKVIGAIIAATSAGQHHSDMPDDDRTLVQAMARDAYELADAMLAERSK